MKKKSYAQKHLEHIENKQPVAIYESLLPPKRTKSMHEAKLMDILLSPESFEKDFLALSLDEQLAMVKLLYQTVEYAKKTERQGVAKDFALAAEYHLNTIHKNAGTSYDTDMFYKIATDEKRLIRMDSYGSINKREPHQLSSFYKYFSKSENRKKWPLSAYNMEKSPMWRVFMQFRSFRQITPTVRKFMQKYGINPDALKVMRVNDFCDIIFKTYQTSTKDNKASFVPEGQSIKAQFVKHFMKICGKKYRDMLLKEGYRSEAVYAVCNAMQKYGITDTNTIFVTSPTYTPRNIKALCEAGYKVENIEVGSKIPVVFRDYLIEHKQAELIQAYDENNKMITADDLPRLEFHHLNAVMFAGANDGIARTNYELNGALVDSRIHSGFIHLFDNIVHQSDNTEQYYSRLNVNNRHLCLMIGFDKSKQLYADMESNLEYVKHANEDTKYIVNYFDMMQEVLNNEAEIVQTYGIEYSRSAVTQVLGEIKSLKDQSDIDTAKLANFENWFKKTHVSSRKEKKKNKKQKEKLSKEQLTTIISEKKGLSKK